MATPTSNPITRSQAEQYFKAIAAGDAEADAVRRALALQGAD